MLYKRGSVWWCDFTDAAGRRHRVTTRQTDKRAAERVERQLRERAALGEVRQVATLEAVAAAWFSARAEDKRSVVTIAKRVQALVALMGPETLVNAIGAREVEAAIQARRLQPIRQDAKRGPSNATVNRDVIDTLRPILRYAAEVQEEPVKAIPWAKLRLPEAPERDRPFTADELARWRSALPPWHRDLWEFVFRYGVRLQEAFFAPDSYDPSEGRVILRTRKNGRQHAIRLQPEDAAAMNGRWARAVAAGLPTVWFREVRRRRDVEPRLEAIKPRGFQSASKAALTRAGVSDARPVHDGRHHAGTTLVRRTGDLAAVKKLLGHESIQSTMRYARAGEDQVFAAMRHAYGTDAEEQPEMSANTKKRTFT